MTPKGTKPDPHYVVLQQIDDPENQGRILYELIESDQKAPTRDDAIKLASKEGEADFAVVLTRDWRTRSRKQRQLVIDEFA